MWNNSRARNAEDETILVPEGAENETIVVEEGAEGESIVVVSE